MTVKHFTVAMRRVTPITQRCNLSDCLRSYRSEAGRRLEASVKYVGRGRTDLCGEAISSKLSGNDDQIRRAKVSGFTTNSGIAPLKIAAISLAIDS